MESGTWVAECIDLDLISEGHSPEDAIGRLQDAVLGYLETAFESPSVESLVLRPAPISHRLRYHWHRLRERALFLFSRRHKHLIPAVPSPLLGNVSRCR